MECCECGKELTIYYKAYGYKGKMLPFCESCFYKKWEYLYHGNDKPKSYKIGGN